MKTIKQYFHSHLPGAYCFLRDIYQFSKFRASGSLSSLLRESSQSESDEEIYVLAEKWLRPYQVQSEILGLIEALRNHQPKTFVEIGTANGGTHFLIRRMCSSIQKSVAIDIDIRNKFIIDRITKTDKSSYILGGSCTPKVLKTFSKLFPAQNGIDLLFIDGDHSYQGVKQDFETYSPFVRPGGFIVLHDIIEDWNQRHGKPTNKYTGGVPRLFSELKDHYPHLRFIEDPEQDGFGIGVLIQT